MHPKDSPEHQLQQLFREMGLSETGATIAAAERSLWWDQEADPEELRLARLRLERELAERDAGWDAEAADQPPHEEDMDAFIRETLRPDEALREAFEGLGLSEDAARIAAIGQGRFDWEEEA